MKTALVAGASGLIGSFLVKLLLEEDQYAAVHILVRKEIDLKHNKLVQHVVDFDQLESLSLDFKTDDAFCTLGTTIAKAGSKEAFIRVDHNYVISFARKALQAGATGLFVVSSMGANPHSSIFYNKVKGRMEEALKRLDCPRLVIFRPSLLLGPRAEKRFAEKFSGYVMVLFKKIIPLKYKAIHASKVAEKMVGMGLTEFTGIRILESDMLQ